MSRATFALYDQPGASLSTGTSPTTEKIVPLNSGINPEKYEHPYQVKDLNPCRWGPPQGTQPAELRSVRLTNYI